MTDREFIEARYILNDAEYLDKVCRDEAEAYEIQKSLSYDNSCWLFDRPNDGLEDDYGEDSLP